MESSRDLVYRFGLCDMSTLKVELPALTSRDEVATSVLLPVAQVDDTVLVFVELGCVGVAVGVAWVRQPRIHAHSSKERSIRIVVYACCCFLVLYCVPVSFLVFFDEL